MKGTIKKIAPSWYIAQIIVNKIIATGYGIAHYKALEDAIKDYNKAQALYSIK